MGKKVISLFLLFCFVWQQAGFAQVHLLNVGGADKLTGAYLRYFQYDNQTDNYRLFMDKGTADAVARQSVASVSQDLLKYFLIGVSLPNSFFWVNLRPDSKNNIMEPALARTDVGKILLAADVELKKDTARLLSIDNPAGKIYWERLYKKAGELYQAQELTIPTYSRPWIIPGEVIIRETGSSVFIYKANLKVMLEQERGLNPQDAAGDARLAQLNEYSAQLMRELIVGELTREVNTAGKYAQLRQCFHSLVMAQWFKRAFSGSQGAYAGRIDSKNLNGLESEIPWATKPYYEEYKKSFSNGESSGRRTVQGLAGTTVRNYSSGGIDFDTASASGSFTGVNEALAQAIAASRYIARLSGNAAHPALTVEDAGLPFAGAVASGAETRADGGAGSVTVAPSVMEELVVSIRRHAFILQGSLAGTITNAMTIPGKSSYTAGYPPSGFCKLAFQTTAFNEKTLCYDMSESEFRGFIAEMASKDMGMTQRYIAALMERYMSLNEQALIEALNEQIMKVKSDRVTLAAIDEAIAQVKDRSFILNDVGLAGEIKNAVPLPGSESKDPGGPIAFCKLGFQAPGAVSLRNTSESGLRGFLLDLLTKDEKLAYRYIHAVRNNPDLKDGGLESPDAKKAAAVGGIDLTYIRTVCRPSGSLANLAFSGCDLSGVSLENNLGHIGKLLAMGALPEARGLKISALVAYSSRPESAAGIRELAVRLFETCRLHEQKDYQLPGELQESLLMLDLLLI